MLIGNDWPCIHRDGTGVHVEDVLDRFAPLDDAALNCLRDEMERGRLSARGYHRVRRVARTIGDLRFDGADVMDEEIIALALGMRVRVRPAHTIGRAA